MDYFEERYEKAMSGDTKAFEEIKAGAEVGNPDAMHLLSCLYGNMDSPFYDEVQYNYWNDKQNEDSGVEAPNEEMKTNYSPNWTAYKKINVWRKFRDIIEIDVNDMERHQKGYKRE